MKKIIYMSICFLSCLLISSCGILSSSSSIDNSLNISPQPTIDSPTDTPQPTEKFDFDIVYLKTLKRGKYIYAFDSSSDRVMYISKGRNGDGQIVTNYHIGTYSGNVYKEMEIQIALGKNTENITSHRCQIKKGKLLLLNDFGEVYDELSAGDVDNLKSMLHDTDYFSKRK